MMRFFDDDESYIIIIPHQSYRRRSRLLRFLMFALKLSMLAVLAIFCYSFLDRKSYPYNTIDAVLENFSPLKPFSVVILPHTA